MGERYRIGIGSRLDGQRFGTGEPMPVSRDAALLRLSDLVASQMHLQRSGGFQQFLRDPLSAFSSSWVTQELYSDIELGDDVYEANEKDFRIQMQGRLFELLSYAVLSAWQPNDRVVLSPKDTLDFFGKLYPRHRKLRSPGGHGSIGGIYVPDGLIIKLDEDGAPKVHRVLEYTTNISEKVKDGKHESDLAKEAMTNPLFSGVEHVLVYPNQLISTDVLDKLEERICYQLPFNASDFRMIADGITSKVLSIKDVATAEDRLGRIIDQEARFDKGFLQDPASWSQYAVNNGITLPLRPEIEEY